MKIPFVDLQAQYRSIKDEDLAAIDFDALLVQSPRDIRCRDRSEQLALIVGAKFERQGSEFGTDRH